MANADDTNGTERDRATRALPELRNDDGLELLAHTIGEICHVAADVLRSASASPSDKAEARRLVGELAIATLNLTLSDARSHEPAPIFFGAGLES